MRDHFLLLSVLFVDGGVYFLRKHSFFLHNVVIVLFIFQNLYTMSPKVKLTDCTSGASPENTGKNRVADILPGEFIEKK